jgi:hypothetical protein
MIRRLEKAEKRDEGPRQSVDGASQLAASGALRALREFDSVVEWTEHIRRRNGALIVIQAFPPVQSNCTPLVGGAREKAASDEQE